MRVRGLKRFAWDLPQSFQKVEKLRDELRRKKRKKTLKGASRKMSSVWRTTPEEEWKLDKFKDDLSRYVVTTKREDWYQVDALWLTSDSYEANRRINQIDPQARDALEGRPFAPGFLPDLEPLAEFADQDVYVLALTFNRGTDGRPPYFWDRQTIEAESFLAYKEDLDHRIRPRVIDRLWASYLSFRRYRLSKRLWKSHPTLFIFPTKLPDGSPFITSLNQKLELHTIVNNHPVLIEYNLAHFGLDRTKELRFNSDEHVARAR